MALAEWLERLSKALAFLVISFFFGGGLNLVLFFKIDPHTGLGVEEAIFLILAFSIYCLFTGLSYLLDGKTFVVKPTSIFELTDVKLSRDIKSNFQGPRFFDPQTPRHEELKSSSGQKKRKKKRKNRRGSEHKTQMSTLPVKMFFLSEVLKAGFDMPGQRGGRRPRKYMFYNFAAMILPFLFMFIPLVPCWQRDTLGMHCSASGSPSAIFIIVWNSLVSFLLATQYSGMVLTVGTLIAHCEGMSRRMRSLVSEIQSIDHLETWHTTLWKLHKHMENKIRPFMGLIVGSCISAIMTTVAAVSLGIAHFLVSDKDEINQLESAWIQLLICSFAFAIPSIFIVAFSAQVNSVISKAIDKLDNTGVGQEISLAEYYDTVIRFWKKSRKGFIFCGINITDLTCFYFSLCLGAIALFPIVYAGSF